MSSGVHLRSKRFEPAGRVIASLIPSTLPARTLEEYCR
jgi:hypothetical protein